MLLQPPDESPYDLRFMLLGFPVRVAWSFWLGAAVFGWGLADGLDRAYQQVSPGVLPLLMMWALCMFVSILIHELGHAMAFRQCGIESAITLYHFGGLAIPLSRRFNEENFSRSFSLPRMSHRQDLWITFAGPLAQLLSAVMLMVVVRLTGRDPDPFGLLPFSIDAVPGMRDGNTWSSFGLAAVFSFYVLPSILWAILNLAPVFPLDGGRIMRSIVLMFRGSDETWLWVSLVSAGACAYLGFRSGQMFLGILFLSFAMENYRMLQGSFGR